MCDLGAGLYVILTDCLPALNVIAFHLKYSPLSCQDFGDTANVLMYCLSNVAGEWSVFLSCFERFVVVFSYIVPGVLRNLHVSPQLAGH